MTILSRVLGTAALTVAAVTLGDELNKRRMWGKIATNSMALALVAIQSTKCQVLVARDGLQDIVADAKHIKEHYDRCAAEKEIKSCPRQPKNIMINGELGG